MTKKVDFYFDFASPNAYLSHKVMQSIKERTGAEINYIPVLLGGIFKLTNNKPPMEQFFGVKNKNEYQNIEMQRFIKRYGLDKFQMNPHFPVISLQIIRGAVAAAHCFGVSLCIRRSSGHKNPFGVNVFGTDHGRPPCAHDLCNAARSDGDCRIASISQPNLAIFLCHCDFG